MSRRTAPPGGAEAPTEVAAPDGATVDVRELALKACARYYLEYDDEEERYGHAGRAWCVHDNQYLIHWAMLDVRGVTSLTEQVAWLARVLDARAFPLDRLRRNLELAADVVEDGGWTWSSDVAERLRAATSAAVEQ